MLKREDVEYLSGLARVAISDEEKDSLAKDLDAILGYVSEVSKIATTTSAIPHAEEHRNVMREDTQPHAGGEWTEAITGNAPQSEDGYVRVRRII